MSRINMPDSYPYKHSPYGESGILQERGHADLNKKNRYHVHVTYGSASGGQVLIVEGDAFEVTPDGSLDITIDGNSLAFFAPGFWAAIVTLPDAKDA